MRALLRKELRQVVPAHALVAVVFAAFALWAIPPETVLLPSNTEAGVLYFVWAMIALLLGLQAGLVQHGRERKAGTEAYLVHRATGWLQPFVAKAVAGTVALALVVGLAPLAYGLWHVVLSPSVENPLTERLGHFVVAGTCGLPAYGIGALVAQLRKGWGSRVLFAVLGGSTLLFVTAVASQPPAGAARTPIVTFLLLQMLLALAVLVVAYRLFRAGDDETRPWPGRLGVAAALTSLALFWIPWTFVVATVQQVARAQVLDAYPLVVEDAGRRLLLATELDAIPRGRRRVRVFELRDAEGQLVDAACELDYATYRLGPDPFQTVFETLSTPLERNRPEEGVGRGMSHPGPFGFDGLWISVNQPQVWPWRCWLRPADGTVHCVGPRQEDGRLSLHRVLERTDGRRGFSPGILSTLRIPERFGYSGQADVLVDLAERTLWDIQGSDESIHLEPLELPDGDAFVGLERLQPVLRARVGLFDPLDVSSPVLFVGERGRYLWTSDGLRPYTGRDQLVEELSLNAVPEGEADEVASWRLEPSRIDGLGFQLEVFDAQSGELALAHDFRPETSNQRSWAAVAALATLARSPVGSSWSYLGAHVDPRDATRLTAHDAFRDPLLLGGANPLLLAASVVVGLLLAWSANRRLGRDPRERGVRWTWTLAIFALGLPAWLLCCTLEPARSALPRLPARIATRPAALIRTDRGSERRAPAPVGL